MVRIYFQELHEFSRSARMQETLRFIDDDRPRAVGRQNNVENCQDLADACSALCQRYDEVLALSFRIVAPNYNFNVCLRDPANRHMPDLWQNCRQAFIKLTKSARVVLEL